MGLRTDVYVSLLTYGGVKVGATPSSGPRTSSEKKDSGELREVTL